MLNRQSRESVFNVLAHRSSRLFDRFRHSPFYYFRIGHEAQIAPPLSRGERPAFVDDDLIQPASKSIPVSTVLQPAVGTHERGLEHVIRIAPRAQHSNREPCARVAVSLEQHTERLDVTTQYFSYQLGVGPVSHR